MSAPSLWRGLGRSPMLGEIGEAERSPIRLVAAIAVGAAAALTAAICAFFVLMIPYTLATGLGARGLEGLSAATLEALQPARWTLRADVVFTVMATVLDAAPIFAFVGVLAAFARRPLHAYATSALAFRWRLMLAGMLLACVVLTPLVVAQRALSHAGPAPILGASTTLEGRALYLAASLLLIPAALGEELLFRGWLTRQVAAFAPGAAPALLLSAALFSLAHFAPDPASADPGAFLELAMMGLAFAYMTLRLGGIEFAAGAHAANNLLIILFIQPVRPQIPTASGGVFSLIPDLAELTGYFIVTEAIARSAILRRLTGVHPRELSPADTLDQAV